MSEGQFSAADLEPSVEEKRAARKALLDRVAASVAVIATGSLVGGMLALGACAAPAVFELAPMPYAGTAMGAAFGRFDRMALGCAAITLAAEVVRTWAGGRRGITQGARVRRGLAVILAAAAGCMALFITPRINELHLNGAVRGQGDDGILLDQIHHRAELIGKVEVVIGIVLVVLHVMTLRVRRPEDEEDAAPGPLPPGPAEP